MLAWLLCASLSFGADLFIRDVSKIDPRSGQITSTSVLISNGAVREDRPRVKAPKDARIVDARGKFLIPGLWDSHFHLIRKSTQNYTRTVWLPMLLSYGITGVRDMGSIPEEIVKLRSDIRAGLIDGPQLYVAGAMVDGPASKSDEVLQVVKSPDGAVAFVNKMAALGVDFLKVQQNISRECYTAVVNAAAVRQLSVMGHLPDALTIDESSQASLEHLTGVLPACSTRETDIREAIRKGAPGVDFGPAGEPGKWTLDNFSEDKAKAFYTQLLRHATFVVPTMVWERAYLYLDESASRSEAEWKFVPKSVRQDEALQAALKRRKPETDALFKAYYGKAASLLAPMQKSGVPIVAGTDGGDEFTIPGFGLHKELELLVEAGLTPLQALQSATKNPVKMMHLPFDNADFVILDANPLVDIRNTRRIHAVVARGKLFDRMQLNAMKNSALQKAME